MKILGVDPGYDKLGYSVFEKNTKKYLASGLLKTDRNKDVAYRIHQIYEKLKYAIEEHSIDQIVCEKLFYFKNKKTVISVAKVIGIVELLAVQNNIPIEFLTPLQIKQAITGYGTADKKSVLKMLKLELGEDIRAKEDDESDAIACGYAYLLTSF